MLKDLNDDELLFMVKTLILLNPMGLHPDGLTHQMLKISRVKNEFNTPDLPDFLL